MPEFDLGRDGLLPLPEPDEESRKLEEESFEGPILNFICSDFSVRRAVVLKLTAKPSPVG